MRRLIVVFTALLVIAIAGTTMLAQRPAATFPVIVVFNDDVPFASYRGMFRADERAQADPDAWSEYMAESEAWDSTLNDGLDDLPYESDGTS